jgi:hypothetical protein
MNAVGLVPREEVEKDRQLQGTMKHDASDPPPKPISDSQYMAPIYIEYVIDYKFDIGEVHHQSFCRGQLELIDPDNPLRPGLMIPFNTNLPGDRLRPDIMSCRAD